MQTNSGPAEGQGLEGISIAASPAWPAWDSSSALALVRAQECPLVVSWPMGVALLALS